MNCSESVTSFVHRHVRGLGIGAASVVGLCLMGAQAQAAVPSSSSAAPSAVSSAQAYVTSNSDKPGVKVLTGHVHGGNGAIAWAVVTIYAAGTSGYGSASVVGEGYTDANGIIHAVIVAKPSQELYLVVTGGYVGGDTYNTAIGLSAPLGTITTLPAVLVVNEASTVASVYALNQFLDPTGQKPGTSSTNVTGLLNALAVIPNLVSLSTGTAATSLVSGAAGSPPTAAVNTLANILAPCITSGSASSSQCSSLFSAATPPSGTAPTTTLAAALDIARNEGSNVATLFAFASGGPFTPALTAAPNDFGLAINYTGGSLDSNSFPSGVTVDASGKAWVSSASSDSTVNGGNGFVLNLSPQGVQSTTFADNGNIQFPNGLTVDVSNNVWVVNQLSTSSVNSGNGSVSGLSDSGASLSGSPFAAGTFPQAIATDPSGNVWVLSTSTDFVTKLPVASSYAPVNFTVTDGGPLIPVLTTFGVDNSGNVWTTDGNNSLLVALSASNPAQQISGSPFPGLLARSPDGLVGDEAGNIWIVAGGTTGITEYVKSASYASTLFSSNDVTFPGQLAVDGAGTVWVANEDDSGRSGVVPISGGGTSLAGAAGTFVVGGNLLATPTSVALDASGNVWLGGGPATNVVELVGAAKPVKTPVAGKPQLP
jgi:sugar lactone lactonase YvrE